MAQKSPAQLDIPIVFLTAAHSAKQCGHAMALPGTEYPEDQPAGAGPSSRPQLTVTRAYTTNQVESKEIFDHDTDGLAFAVDVAASPEVNCTSERARISLWILDVANNTPALFHALELASLPADTHFSIVLGRAAGPKPSDRTTPAWWGLSAGLYMCRLVLEIPAAGVVTLSDSFPVRVS
jgi:hypothetical protein